MDYYYIKNLHKPRKSQTVYNSVKKKQDEKYYIQIDLENLERKDNNKDNPNLAVTYVSKANNNFTDWEEVMSLHLNGKGVILKNLQQALNKNGRKLFKGKDKDLPVINADDVEIELLAEPTLIEDCVEEYYGGKNTFTRLYEFKQPNRLH